jgi:hypothetical protein
VKVTATIDYYDDQIDVYRVALSGGEKVAAKLTGGWSARTSISCSGDRGRAAWRT